MASTEDRLRTLIAENLEVDGQPIALPDNLDISLMEAGISSVDLVAFAKLVAKEFEVKFTLEDCGEVKSVRDLVNRLDEG
ncbi:MAG: acyl carrier protein [Gemmatimonadota bacterium]|nr:acyl carrier protein [Gemmatimonadota bacterium]